MKALHPSLLALCLLSVGNPAWATALEHSESLIYLDIPWLMHQGDSPQFAAEDFDDSSWNPVPLPRRAESLLTSWQGTIWYRVHIDANREVLGNNHMLSLGPINGIAEVFLNGGLIAQRGSFAGRLKGGASARIFTAHIPAGLLKAGDNLLAVRVMDPAGTGGIAHGPLLLGNPTKVTKRVTPSSWHFGARIGLGMVCLTLALLLTVAVVYRRSFSELGWLALSAWSLGVLFLDGTGGLDGVLDNLSLASRLPVAAAPTAMLGLFSFVAHRYGNPWALQTRVSQIVLGLVAAFLFLASDAWIPLIAPPMVMVTALLTSLYASRLLYRSARRQENGALAMLVASLVAVVAVLADGIFTPIGSAAPTFASYAGLLALVTGMGTAVIEHVRESNRTRQELAVIREAVDWHQSWSGMLDACAIAIEDADRFFYEAVREAARVLRVRRCSIILREKDKSLRIRAALGLPTDATNQEIQEHTGISGWVLSNKKTLTAESMPGGSDIRLRHRRYATAGFVSTPIFVGHTMAGVLNVSDRNDAAPFSEEQVAAVEQFAARIGHVLHRLMQ